MKGLVNIQSRECYSSILRAVFQMLVEGKSTTFIQDHISIPKDSLDVMRKATAKDVSELINLIIARDAISLKVDPSLVERMVASFNSYLPNEIRMFMESQAKNVSKVKYKIPVYQAYVKYLNSAVSSCLSMDLAFNAKEAFGVSNGIIREMMELKAAYIPSLELALIKKNTIKVEVNELALNTCLVAFAAKQEGQELVLKLIKSGANHCFIKQYNKRIDVTTDFVQKWRDIFGVNPSAENVSVKNGIEIWNDFNVLAAQQLDIVDIYLQLNRKHKHRIDTLYLYITSTARLEAEMDEEEDEDESREVFQYVK